jgi:hypothetical protein
MHTHRITAPLCIALLLAAPAAFAGAKPQASREVRLTQIVEGDEAGAGHLETFTVPALPGQSAARGIQPGEVLGEQTTLVTLVNFTNDPSTPLLVADADGEILDETNPASAASYVLEASYGRAWLAGSVQGWLSASYDDSSCLVRTHSGTQQLIDDLDPAIDFSQVERWIIIIPQNPSCGFAGISSLGKWSFTSDEGAVSFSRVILNGPSLPFGLLTSHELGHSFAGLQHAQDWECGATTIGSGCVATGTDRYDVMASNAAGGHYAPSDKQALEWFDTQIVDVGGAGGTYLIEPYETTGAGIKALRIRADGPYDDYRELDDYWVSYRKPLGFDAGFGELATDGAMLNLGTRYFPEYTTDATGMSLLLDARPGSGLTQTTDSQDVLLEAGQSFVDGARGISIETLGTVGSALEVQVTITQYCGNGVRDAAVGEACDGSDLGSATCSNLGFTSGTLACDASCGYDTSACGPAVCAPGDHYDEGANLCTASFPGAGPADMGLYSNWIDWSQLRTIPTAKLLTVSRGYLGINQNFSGTSSVLFRLNLPFDTSALPDGASIESATLHLAEDAFNDPYNNDHPSSADQLILVQTQDPQPTVREKSDFGAFLPIDNPPEGAPRIDVSDTYVPGITYDFPLNATGMSWIDDQGFTLLGLRTGWDVDDVYVAPPDVLDFNISFVPTDSPVSGPRLDVTYHPLPEPGAAAGIVSGALLLGWLRRRRAD